MPPWGRPPGGRKGKGRRQSERQQREWDDIRRFEELDSESDDGQGVGLGFAGDELQFTGADMGRDLQNIRNFRYSDESGDSDSGAGDDMQSGAAMQLALRDKEEVLVQRAMERIRRAQLLGKTNVKLTPPEHDALARRMQKDQAKSTRPVSRTKVSDGRRDSGRSSSSQSGVAPIAGRRKSRSSLSNRSDREVGSAGQPVAPGFVVAGPDGRPVYAPIGYYPPSPGSPYGPSSQPGSRTGSSHSLQHTPPLPQSQFRGAPMQRYFSGPEQQFQPSSAARGPPSPRPMPDELEWQPRPRSSSNLGYPADQYRYQYTAYPPTVPQMPSQYTQGRRNVSGPAGVGYSNIRAGPLITRPYASSSDPSLLRREVSGGNGQLGNTSEDDVDDDDEDASVQVNVVPHGQGYDVKFSEGRQRRSRR